MSEESRAQIRISVRGLVEFLLRNGDIDNRRQGGSDNAMAEGSRIHRLLQKRMGSEYRAEVPLRYACDFGEYDLVVEGRADGIYPDRRGGEPVYTVDEIKGTYRNIDKMKAPDPLHLAQARVYAYIYALNENLTEISVRISYCQIETEQVRYFYDDMSLPALTEWFSDLLGEYRKWSDLEWEWAKKRTASIHALEFPYPYREGQKSLAVQVYQTIAEGKRLFLEAPTGVGKTLSTVFPSLKAMGTGRGEKLFYLTAKTVTGTVAEETVEILRENGLRLKSIFLTAKEKVCMLDRPACNPEECPCAGGHYDRINEALYDLLTSREAFTADTIAEYAEQYNVCPFELSLDASLFADMVICDYNYLFDPHAYLKRFFGDGITGDYLFLVDEAHNLVERGREMYSAVIVKEVMQHLRREISKTILSETAGKSAKSQVKGQMTLDMTLVGENSSDSESVTDDFPEEMTENTPDMDGFEGPEEDGELPKTHGGTSILVKNGYAEKMVTGLDKINKVLLSMKRECPDHKRVESIDALIRPLERFYGTVSDYLEERERGREDLKELREELLDVFFDTAHFLETAELLDENYEIYSQLCDDGSFMVKLFCMNPGENLRRCLEKGRAGILFSATMLPIQYYKKLLGGTPEDYEVYAKSIFTPDQRLLSVGRDVTSRYQRRGPEEYRKIAKYIAKVAGARSGNYLVFFPSYVFLRAVLDIFLEEFPVCEQTILAQEEKMSEADRRAFLSAFREAPEEGDPGVIGFCIMGGIFGEGIDLQGDSLIGVIVVGTGIPQVCYERELLRDYFEEESGTGFDYAYRFPGMNKVQQAAGRVIRTAKDRGVILLLDDRFMQPESVRLFPREWSGFRQCTLRTIDEQLEQFWSEQE